MPPTLVLVRHAQALHNLPDNKCPRARVDSSCGLAADLRIQNYTLHDPELSELGRTQCQELGQHLQAHLPAELDIGLLLCSPMRRTCETAVLSLGFLIQKGVPIQANAGWQENSAKPCDVGSPLPDVAREFPLIDFALVDPVYPDKTSPAGDKYRYKKANLIARGQSVLEELYHRPEKAVLVVSHSAFLRQCVTGDHFFNADYRIYDFAERAEGDTGPFRLRQWDQTKGKGGMGRSYDEVVDVGIGLPEEELPPGAEEPLPPNVKPN